MTDAEVANLIFHPGFSTARQVTMVSGRGVGMDAVRGLISGLGGAISVSFRDDNVGAEYRAFSLLLTLPGSLAVMPPQQGDEAGDNE